MNRGLGSIINLTSIVNKNNFQIIRVNILVFNSLAYCRIVIPTNQIEKIVN